MSQSYGSENDREDEDNEDYNPEIDDDREEDDDNN